MRPVSGQWQEIIKGSHRVVTDIRVYEPSGASTPLDVVSGSVTLDAKATTRGMCDFTLPGVDWVPRSVTDRLAPYGNEINVRRGIYLPDGSTETVSLGWFGIEDVEVVDDANLETRVTGLDRSARLSRAKFEEPYALAPATKVTEGILALARDAWPDVPVQPGFVAVSNATLTVDRPVTAVEGDDRWEVMQGLATAVGMRLFFDNDGLLTIRPYAPSGAVAEFVEGDGGVLLSASRSWSRTDAFNRVIVTAETAGADDVFRAVATDDNPFSPTYYFGDFGKCPVFYSNQYVATQEAAQDVAEAMLAQELGTASSVSFGVIPNPALEPEDTVLIKRERAGINETHVLDSVSIGLAADESMSGVTRERLVGIEH